MSTMNSEVKDEVVAPELSPARKRLERQSDSLATYEPFSFEGEAYHIKRLSYGGYVALGANLLRGNPNFMKMPEIEQAKATISQALTECVYNESHAPFFGPGDAEAYIDDPAQSPFIAALYLQCNVVNPVIAKAKARA